MSILTNILNLIRESYFNDGDTRHHFKKNIILNSDVLIVQKHNQRTDNLDKVKVVKILSPGARHSRGLKIKGQDKYGNILVGRVQKIL